jgi:transcriptional regulator with XRE-family HTH domain
MPTRQRTTELSAARLAETMSKLRRTSKLTQTEVAARMGTTQTAVARLEGGKQSPTINTLQNFARANGFCLEIGFVQAAEEGAGTGCILMVDYHASDARDDEAGSFSDHLLPGL